MLNEVLGHTAILLRHIFCAPRLLEHKNKFSVQVIFHKKKSSKWSVLKIKFKMIQNSEDHKAVEAY